MVVHGAPADGDRPRGRDPHQRFIFQRSLRQLRHIPRSGIVAFVIQPVGIGKGGVLHPQRPGLFVHHGHKAFDAAADVLGNGHRRIVAGTQQQSVQQRFQRQGLPFLQVHGRPLREGGLPADLHRVGQLPCLHGHQRREDLGGAGNEHFSVGIALIEYPAAAGVHQDGGCCRGFNGKCPARNDTVQAQCRKEAADTASQQKASLPKLRCL